MFNLLWLVIKVFLCYRFNNLLFERCHKEGRLFKEGRFHQGTDRGGEIMTRAVNSKEKKNALRPYPIKSV